MRLDDAVGVGVLRLNLPNETLFHSRKRLPSIIQDGSIRLGVKFAAVWAILRWHHTISWNLGYGHGTKGRQYSRPRWVNEALLCARLHVRQARQGLRQLRQTITSNERIAIWWG